MEVDFRSNCGVVYTPEEEVDFKSNCGTFCHCKIIALPGNLFELE